MLNQNNAERLCKILGMLGSDHAGEVADAGRAAHRLLSDCSVSWQQVIRAVAPTQIPESNQQSGNVTDWLRMARYCNSRCWLLTAVEQRFVRQMLEQRRHHLKSKRIGSAASMRGSCGRRGGYDQHQI
jgi:hypothetical protein